MPSIDYYFSSSSPFTYLGNAAIQAVAEKHNCTLNIKPVNVFALWEQSGAVPPAQRPPVRQRMRLVELQRLSLHRGLPLNKQPKFFPTDPTLCDCTIIALQEADADPRAFMTAAFSGVWVNEQNIADEETLKTLLRSAGHDADPIMERAKSEEIIAKRNQNSADAVAADAPGVPSYVLNGECFWGQDRIALLEEALESGREPFKP